MRIFGSSQRVRTAALLVVITGGATFIAAQSAHGTAAYVLVAVSVALFIVEVVLGIIDSPEREDR